MCAPYVLSLFYPCFLSMVCPFIWLKGNRGKCFLPHYDGKKDAYTEVGYSVLTSPRPPSLRKKIPLSTPTNSPEAGQALGESINSQYRRDLVHSTLMNEGDEKHI